MGAVYRKTATKPLPAGAEIFTRKGERFARWKGAKGKTRTAPLTTGRDGQDRIVVTAATFTAKFRDGSGIVQEVATGCRDEAAARSLLTELERRAEKVKGKILTVCEAAAIDYQTIHLSEHFEAFKARRTKRAPNGLSAVCRSNATFRLNRIATDCGFQRLSDMSAAALDRWMGHRLIDGMTPSNINEYRQEFVGFGNWCVRTGRLVSNPFSAVAKADTNAKGARKRRSMTEAELVKLLEVARRRPLAEHGRLTVRKEQAEVKRKRDTWHAMPLSYADLDTATERARQRLAKNPALVERLETLGRERALIYKVLVLTGLRKGELASLTVGQLHLDGPAPHAELAAADEKNRQGSQIPLRHDLASDLAQWVDLLGQRFRGDAGGSGGHFCLPMTPVPRAADLPDSTPVFAMPDKLVKILDRDLKLAGIAKRDERGRTLDVHALRHSFGTLLSKGGVTPRTAQAAMRHSSINLTMNVYTDPKLLDVFGALDSLPALPLDAVRGNTPDALTATGTDDLSDRRLHQSLHQPLTNRVN